MFRLKIMVIGKNKKSPLQELTEEYLKRIKPFAVVEILEISETTFYSTAEKEKVLKTETEKIRKTVPQDSFLIVLDAAGKTFTSEKFAVELDRLAEGGAKPLTIVIGGPLGLSDELKKEADLLLSLSPMTMPHDLARVVLLEQLYRAGTILRGKTYHY